jgi:3-hydroxyisobutyrate dehydrogenase-like beta-hydroxyacid dehydrogenase
LPQAILPRTVNYGFATALMLKDVRVCVEEAKGLDVPNSVMSAFLDQWETTNA